MLCPYCKQEMIQGNLIGTNGYFVYWLPKEYYNKHTFLPITKKKIEEAGGVIIHTNYLTATPDYFYVCKNCKKMISDIN
ncbi:MAG: hypothetical protein K2G88_01935 [Oscillospiraceae bacterium]|nr:hypothetical protein [Oscillospiraceae bacterium]